MKTLVRIKENELKPNISNCNQFCLWQKVGFTNILCVVEESLAETHENNSDSFSESEDQDCELNWRIFGQQLA